MRRRSVRLWWSGLALTALLAAPAIAADDVIIVGRVMGNDVSHTDLGPGQPGIWSGRVFVGVYRIEQASAHARQGWFRSDDTGTLVVIQVQGIAKPAWIDDSRMLRFRLKPLEHVAEFEPIAVAPAE